VKSPDGREVVLDGITVPGWTPEADEARFFEEVARRVGASIEGIRAWANENRIGKVCSCGGCQMIREIVARRGKVGA
jgi:hypothetical protein